METLKPFPPKRDFSSLSVQDLLEARDAYHVHLAHLANVTATAIGRYRIRCGDWSEEHPPNVRAPEGYKPPAFARTLENSRVLPWSWPCVLVFVNDWVGRERFGSKKHQKTGGKSHFLEPDQMVPRALYLSDGRVIPTCVIQVTQQDAPLSSAQKLSFPSSFIGGGNLLASDVQGREHLGSVGALVSDGNQIYALTNRHVTGEEGREIYSVFGETKVRVGVSDKKQIAKKPFSQAYDGWPGTHVLSNLDAGLVRVDDLSQWTTQIVGLGSVDRPADLTTDTITLDLIGCHVCAFGGASGPLLGQIDGLFYRYKSVGGMDYVADLLIGPRLECPHAKRSEQANERTAPVFPGGGSPGTLPGDSGTLWCLEQPAAEETPPGASRRQKPRKPTLRPIALQWGGHVVVEEGTRKTTAHSYALATCLSTVCRELDVDLVRDWNSGLPEYWGDVGHYTIAALACLHVAAPGVRTLMTNNLDRVSYEEANIRPANFKGLSKQPFVPLADVPDKVWKMFGDGRRGAPEHPNHFADMDKKDSKGKTLLQICGGGGAAAGKIDPAKVKVDVWRKYYDDVKDDSRGCLPFRVWQIYGAMVDALEAGDVVRFVCAAGLLAHYVGDACQPLHISYMFDGDPADTVTVTDKNGRERQVPRARGVHTAYETKMLNSHVVELIEKLNKRLESAALKKPKAVASGHTAAVAVVDLMDRTFRDLDPPAIIKAFNDETDLWTQFGDKTVDLMARGALTLAMLWESAWKQGHGKTKISDADLGPVDEKELAKLYLDTGFLPSKTIDQIGDLLK